MERKERSPHIARVLLLSLLFAPDGVSTSVLMSELALELKTLGHEVTVFTTTPHYNVEPEARAEQPLTRRWDGILYESNYQGISVYHAAMPIKGSRVQARLLDYARFHAISTIAGLIIAGDYDVILVPSPPLTIGLSAWLLGLIKRIPFIYNVQEIYPDVAVSLGVLSNPFLIRLAEQLERFIYNRAKRVSVISEWFRRRLHKKGVSDEKMVVIPNFVDTEFIQPKARQNSFSTEHGLNNKFVVLYAGNIGLTQGFETIMDAASKVEHLSDLQFLIVGDGTRRVWLEQQLAKKSSPNLMLLPYQPRSRVPELYGTGDICLVPLKKGTATTTFPSKIYTIMAANRPVIASADADSELAWVVEQANCGWSVPPDDAAALASAIEYAYHHRNEAYCKGKQGRDFVLSYHSRQAVAKQYDALIREVTKERKFDKVPKP